MGEAVGDLAPAEVSQSVNRLLPRGLHSLGAPQQSSIVRKQAQSGQTSQLAAASGVLDLLVEWFILGQGRIGLRTITGCGMYVRKYGDMEQKSPFCTITLTH